MHSILRSPPFLVTATSDEETAKAEIRELRLQALRWMDEWSMVFANYLSYSEVWGERRRGLTHHEVLELNIAYDEWDRLCEARRKWKESGDRDSDPVFDRGAYLEKRREEIEDET